MTHLLEVYKQLPLTIVRGAGAWTWDLEGRRFLDMYGGHAVCATGHAHPRLVRALTGQMAKLLFYSNAVHVEHQEEAASLLAELLPAPLGRIFFCNSGAEAVENALKIARLATGRSAVLAFHGGFHGRTLGALAATGLEKYRRSAGLTVAGHRFAPFGEPSALAAAFAGDPLAAVIVEPIQSLAGVRTAAAPFFQELRRLCDAHGTLLIYDELQTGVGRTGTPFFAPRHGVVPDLMALGKGLGSGLPVAATVVATGLAAKVKAGDCGSTFGGGPLACLAVKTTLEILKDEALCENARVVGEVLAAALRQQSGVREVRGEGLLLGVVLEAAAQPMQKALLDAGVIAGTADEPQVLRLMPPLTLTKDEAQLFVEAFVRAAEALYGDQ